MIEPSYGYMAKAYTMTGFPLTDSVEKRSKHLSKEEIIERRITAEKVLDSFTYKFWEEKSEADLDGVSAKRRVLFRCPEELISERRRSFALWP